jgi:fructokinase
MVIVVAGEALVDLLIRPGGAITAVPGGGMFNTARTIARLGQAVAFLGRLSDDGFGRMLWAALAADGVEGSFVEVTLAPTTLAIAELDAAGAASYRFHVAETSAPGLSGDAVRAALAVCPRALCVGSLGLVLEPMAAAVAEGVARTDPTTFVMLDPNCRPALIADRRSYLDRLDPIVRRADVVKLSRDDLAYLAPGIDAIPAARDLLGRGPAAILLTDGPGVVVGLTSTFECELPVPPIEVVDTIGAGDALGGAFLARWVERGYGRVELADEALVRDALEWAIEVAALTCRRPGADPPRRDDLP